MTHEHDQLKQRQVLIEQSKEQLPSNLLLLRQLSDQISCANSKFELICFHGHQNLTCLNQARVLLYDYYVKQLHWEITANNPSGLHISDQFIFQWIEDDYDLTARWFVLRDSKHVVACARLCFPDTKGLLEIERYENARCALNPLFETHKKQLLELNREAILITHINITDCYLLLQAIFEYCIERQQMLLTTTNIREWVKCYKNIGFAHQAAYRFKYFDYEKKPVNVYIAETKDLKRMLGVIQCQLKQLNIIAH